MKAGSIYTLPSGNIVRITGVQKEDVKASGDKLGERDVITAVYETRESEHMKQLVIRRDWFEKFALAL